MRIRKRKLQMITIKIDFFTFQKKALEIRSEVSFEGNI